MWFDWGTGKDDFSNGVYLGETGGETSVTYLRDWTSGVVGAPEDPNPTGKVNQIKFKASRKINILNTGKYFIIAGSDDGIRLYVDNNLILDHWHDHSYGTPLTNGHAFYTTLTSGLHNFEIDYYEDTGDAKTGFDFYHVCDAPTISDFGATENTLLLILNKVADDNNAHGYEAQWCMNEHGVSSFTDPLCCTNPNGCSKTVVGTESPWYATVGDTSKRYIDIENFDSTGHTPDALFSKTKYNMRVRTLCEDINSVWSPATNDWLTCTVLGFCYSTVDMASGCPNLNFAPQTENIAFGPCTVQLSPYAQKFQDNDITPKGPGKYGDYFTFTSGGTTVKKVEFDDQDGGSCDIDYGFTNKWRKPASDWLEVTTKVYRKEGGSSHQQIGADLNVAGAGCKIRKWNGIDFGNCITSDRPKIAPNAVPGNSLTDTYNVEWCGDGTVTTGVTGCTNEVCDPPGVCHPTTPKQKCGSTCTAWVSSCGDGVVNCGEDCEPGQTAPCTDANGDAGTKTCTASCGWGSCVLSCNTNTDCGANRCCRASGPNAADHTCRAKGVDSSTTYLCDPGEWIKCGDSNVGVTQEFNGEVFICTKENGDYKWEEKTSSRLQSEDVLNVSQIFLGLIALIFVL